MTNEEIKEKVDNLIDKMNQICQMQKEMGLSIIEDFSGVLVYKTEVFLKYADVLNCQIRETGYKCGDGSISVCFEYRGYAFRVFVKQEEYDQIKEKVLPPTKVTEPIRENE